MRKITIDKYQTYFFLEKDNKIIYIQESSLGGYSVASSHKPSKFVGTGYRLTEDGISKETILKNLDYYFNSFVPEWAKEDDLKHVIKYSSFDEFINTKIKFWGKDRVEVKEIIKPIEIFN